MDNNIIGKVLINEKDEEYMVLGMLSYKSIPCVIASAITKDGSEGEKKFFQLTGTDDVSLVTIKNKKMLNALKECIENEAMDMPRKIRENETIVQYMTYLNDFYKTRVVSNM